MAPRLKSWESPRRRGRNNKGKGGSARARQIRKQQKMLRQRLKDNAEARKQNNDRGGENVFSPALCSVTQDFIDSCRRHEKIS